MRSPVDVTYLADTVIMLRFFEARGSVRRAISVIKKRTGAHEDTIREFWIDGGLHVGEPLTNFQGVLRGVPLILYGEAAAAATRWPSVSDRQASGDRLRALILAPRGRDAAARAVAAEQAGVDSDVCRDLPALLAAIGRRRGFVLLTEEAIRDADLAPLVARWRRSRPGPTCRSCW